MNRYEERLTSIYNEEVRRGTIKEVPQQKRAELVERFIQFYKRFDQRLTKIDRNKVIVKYTKSGKIRVCCTYYNKYYGQIYN